MDPTALDLDALEQRFTRLCMLLQSWEADGRLDDGDALADQLDRDSERLIAYARALEAERERLRAALEQFGRHYDLCQWRAGAGCCTCGLWAALAAAAPEAP